MVVLPAPVGPTMAIVWPGSTSKLNSSISGLAGSYRKLTFSKLTRPRSSGKAAAAVLSGISSSASRNSKTRSAEAMPDCSRLIWPASCISGMVNCREYWMKAWTSPSDIVPEATL